MPVQHGSYVRSIRCPKRELSGDGRLLTVTDEKGSQSYAYDPTTGEMTKLLDSAAGTFTASFDIERQMTSETYPNGMTATYTRDQSGKTVGIEYVKTTHCTEKCVLFSEIIVPSIGGETLSRSNTLTSDAYIYDAANRLTQTTETPAEKGCTTRIYAYDEESNRTGLTTREPGLEGKCATEGGTMETHTYDAGNRLIDAGVTYDPFGDTTKLPAADAGGFELTSEYYVDGQVMKQIQHGQTNKYFIDPAGRVRKTVGEGTTNLTTIDHYSGGGEALTWTDEGESKYTRMIPGIDGSLSATQVNGGTPALQLHDLQGDVVGTAALSETETKLLSTYNSTEFGVQVNGPPPTKYSWLGDEGVSSELSSGTLIMGTVAYVPQLGRALQTQAVIPPGMAINGVEGVPYIAQASGWSIQAGENQAKGEAQNYEVELQKAAEREAEEKSCPIASMCVTPEEGGAEEEPAEEYDPEGLASYKTTKKRAGQLRKDATNGALIGLALDIVLPGAADGGAAYAAILEASAYNLELCVETGKSIGGQKGSWGTCYINEWRAEKFGISVPVSVSAEFCEYVGTRQWGKKAHKIYYCVDAKVDRWGPWY